MSEHAAWADLPSVATIVTSLSWSDPTYMYLELVPQTLLVRQEQENGIRLERLDSTTSFDTWQRGRIFNTQQEIKWEQRKGRFHTVYCGQQVPSGFTIIPLYAAYEQTHIYYLWGKRVEDNNLKLLGLDSGAQAFVELQVRRILRYPIEENTSERVSLVVHELYTADGSLCYSRWCGFEAKGKANESL